MKLGCCAYSFDREKDPAGIASIPIIKKIGYDYIELNLTNITALSDEDFQKLLDALKEHDLPCEACNVFFPGSLRLTGPNMDPEKIKEHLAKALPRAKAVGAEVIVFGSAGAKNYPEGFPKEEAYKQVVEVCKLIEPYAAKEDIMIAIEPLNFVESNLINTVEEGYQLAKDASQPHIKLLVDYFHWVRNKEPLEEVTQCGDLLIHSHFAEDIDRAYPCEDKKIYRDFMETLKATGYNARMSIESNVKGDFETEATASYKLFRENYVW